MNKQLNVSIMGRMYKIGCPEGEEENLYQAVSRVDAEMQKLSSRLTNVTPDRLAVMVALNVTHTLMANESLAQQHETALNALVSENEKLRVQIENMAVHLTGYLKDVTQQTAVNAS